ncbi:MAG: nitrile hydratase subunit alpha [Candidatus Velthaea sp.]
MNEPDPRHDHDHHHAYAHDHGSPSAQATQRVNALVATLDARGITNDAELTAILERFLAQAGPLNGARLVARAWSDAGFKERLLADGNTAIVELGLDMSHWSPVKLCVVANTPDVHNVIVCTLCSCYPIALLGPAPTWYKSEAYRSRVVREPRAVLREFGVTLDDHVEVKVWDSTSDLRYLVVPMRPPGTDALNEEDLAALVPRDALIGVAQATQPALAGRG